MLINRDSRPWIIFCLVALAAASVFYFFIDGLGQRRLNGPSGGSWEGLVFGAAGIAMMYFALLLGLRKRFRTMRVGRAYWWMQGHVWLGLLAYPIILYHAGFKPNLWGGTLTQVIMWLFTIVIVSGIVGLAIQQFMPTKLLRDVPMETIYDQIGNVLAQLRAEAEGFVNDAMTNTEEDAFLVESIAAGSATATAVPPRRKNAGVMALKTFYDAEVVPFLQDRMPRGGPLSTETSAANAFNQITGMVPGPLKKTVQDLQDIVTERRQLAKQRQLHNWLHGWLLVHVPLSYALMVLATVHAVQALRYTTIGG